MLSNRSNFIPRNEDFVCEACGQHVVPARGTFRNHCPKCLTSKHVDHTPGDRANPCRGLMPAMRVEGIDPDKLTIIQQCKRCGFEGRNRRAADDDFAALQSIMQNRMFF